MRIVAIGATGRQDTQEEHAVSNPPGASDDTPPAGYVARRPRQIMDDDRYIHADPYMHGWRICQVLMTVDGWVIAHVYRSTDYKTQAERFAREESDRTGYPLLPALLVRKRKKP